MVVMIVIELIERMDGYGYVGFGGGLCFVFQYLVLRF